MGKSRIVLPLAAILGCGSLGCSSAPLASHRADVGNSPLDSSVSFLPDAAAIDNADSAPDSSSLCTTIGCRNQFVATVTLDVTKIPSGTHVVGVTVDGAKSFCSFSFPRDPGFDAPPCTAGFTLKVVLPQNCTTGQADAAASDACQATDTLTETIVVDSAPLSVEIDQTVNGTSIFDMQLSPTYQTVEPNGPNCEPTCQQATVAWTIPQ